MGLLVGDSGRVATTTTHSQRSRVVFTSPATTAGYDVTATSSSTATSTSTSEDDWLLAASELANSTEAILDPLWSTAVATEGGGPMAGVTGSTGPEWQLVECKWGLTHRSYETAVDARMEHRWAWLLYTYGFACLFFMLAFYAFFSILNLRAQISARPYMSSINVFLCLLGSSRAICFLLDPSDYKGLMPETIGWILFELAFPCLISAFGLIQLAFLQLTRLHLGPSQLRSKSCISLVITTHFCFTIAINIMLPFHRPDFTVFCFISQTVFVGWGTGLCVTFLFGGYKMMRLLRRAPASMFQRSDSSGFENKVLALGMLANCHNLAAMTVAAAAAAPSFLAAPKIRITDENEQTYSYVSDNSQLSGSQNLHAAGNGVIEGTGTDADDRGPSLIGAATTVGSAIYTLSGDVAAAAEEDCGDEQTRMLPAEPAPVSRPYSPRPHTANQHPARTPPSRASRQRSSPTKQRAGSKNGVAKTGSEGRGANKSLANGSVKTLGDHVDLLGVGRQAGGGSGASGRFTASQGIGRELKHDLTLVSILNHIAYVNQSVDELGVVRRMQASCKSQVERVLHGTYASSALGLLLCVLEVCRMYGPVLQAVGGRVSPWTYFAFVSLHRFVEFAMGCAMANITKQPVNRHQYPAYHPCHMKNRPNGLYF